MSVEDEEIVNSTNNTEEAETTNEAEETTTEVETEGEPEHTEFEKKQFERAKKAEAENKRLKAELAKAKTNPVEGISVSIKDQLALNRANIHEDDIEEVMDYAKYKGITIAEALKNPVIQATLKDKVENRKTAEVTNTSGSKRTSTKVTDEQLIQKANEGKDVDPVALAEAEMNVKKAKFKR